MKKKKQKFEKREKEDDKKVEMTIFLA
jgi:hypothetical protein